MVHRTRFGCIVILSFPDESERKKFMNRAQAIVVDDNDDNLVVLSELLAMNGVDCIRIQRPTDVNAVLNSLSSLNLVFLDLEMPRMNGYEVLETVKQHPRFGAVPVVAYTVHVSEVNTAHRLGFHSFIGKPVDADAFPGHLAKLLQGEPVWSLP